MVVYSRLGFIFTSNTDVSALGQNFIKTQPVVYCGRRLPRLIFLQCIPFCSFLAPKYSQVGILCWCYISKLYSGIAVHLFNSDGASDRRLCRPCLGSAGRGLLPLLSIRSPFSGCFCRDPWVRCRGCNGCSVWDQGRGQESLWHCKVLHPYNSSVAVVGAELHAEDRCGDPVCSLGK